MLSSVLRWAKAIDVNIKLVRAFMEPRKLTQRIAALEKTHDGQFKAIFVALHELMSDPRETTQKRVGVKSANQT